MENIRIKIDVRLVSTKKKKKKTIWNGHQNQAACHKKYWTVIVAVGKSKVTLTLNKPEYAGICILDLSKL